jgi:protein-L-isoaspartate(D-aspartate) O-methyltransferase
MTKEELIKELIDDGYLKTPAIIDAFKAIDRKDFVPEEIKDQVYLNMALPIGKKQTISQPLVVAFMLELLELKSGEKVLEIGTGSGWNTVLMARIIGETGKIISIERIEELYNFAKQNISKYNFLEKGIVELILGDGSIGCKKQAPFDKVIAAAAAEEIPLAWKEQLKIGGRIVAPVKDSIVALDKISKDEFGKKEYFGFSFVPLIKG